MGELVAVGGQASPIERVIERVRAEEARRLQEERERLEAEEEAERALLEAARRANLAVEIQIRAMLSCLDASREPPASSQVEIAGSSHVFSAALPITA